MKLLATPPDLNKIARPNWIEINLDALCNNIQFIRSQIPTNTKILLPVKADSYGHGSLACSFAAKFGGADYLGVAHISEGSASTEWICRFWYSAPAHRRTSPTLLNSS